MTKGYKATYNYKCLNQIYEVGQEYKLDCTPVICKSGFHYCLNAKHTLYYYNYNHKFKLLEIEDLSNNTITEDDKSCSNHIKVIREITDPEELMQLLECFRTFNEKGQILTCKDSYGYWHDETHKNSYGYLQELTFKNSDGYWRKSTYDKNGNELTYKTSTGFWREYTYDENGNQLTHKSGNNND